MVGHVLNDYLRRLSGSRDHVTGAVFVGDETLPSCLACINAAPLERQSGGEAHD